MKLENINGKYYLVSDNGRIEINQKVAKAFIKCYEVVPAEKFPYLLLCNNLANFSENYITSFPIKNGAVGFAISEKKADGTLRPITSKEETGEIIKQANEFSLNKKQEDVEEKVKEEINRDDIKPNDKNITAKNVKVFKRAKKKDKKKVSKKKVITKILMAASAVAIVLASLNVGWQLFDSYQSRTVNNDYVASHTIDREMDETPVAVAMPSEENDGLEYTACPYHFEGNVVSYIEAPGLLEGTYPIVKSSTYEDYDYYLHHDVDGNYTKYGTIFKDVNNGEGLSDDVTIFYGHNITGDDAMFGKLSDMADKTMYGDVEIKGQDLYDQNHILYYTDEYGKYELDIFASGVYDGNGIVSLAGNVNNKQDFDEMITKINSESDIVSSTHPEYGDKIVILQSCPDENADDYGGMNRIYNFCKATQLEKYNDLSNEVTVSRTR